MNQARETFHKSERLCSRKTLTALFGEGNIFYCPLFKVVWMECSDNLPLPAQIAFSVSKKGFRNAVTRNLIKRRLREAYRKNKKAFYEFLQAEKIQVAFIIIYRENVIHEYVNIEKSLKEMLKKFIMILNEKKKKC
jgi:ribonuclease P protein component